VVPLLICLLFSAAPRFSSPVPRLFPVSLRALANEMAV